MFRLLITLVFLSALDAVVAKTASVSTAVSFKLHTHNKTKYKTHYITPGRVFHCCVKSYQAPPLDIFCYKGHEPRMEYFWQVAILQISLLKGEYEHYVGESPDEVVEHYMEKQQPQVENNSHIVLNPFTLNCVGIVSSHPRYRVVLQLEQYERRSLLLFCIGVCLYTAASNVHCVSLHKRWGLRPIGVFFVWVVWTITKGVGLALLRGSSYNREASIIVAFAFPIVSVATPLLGTVLRAIVQSKLASDDIPEEDD